MLCNLEMKLMEYETLGVGENISPETLLQYKQSADQIADWIKPYSAAYNTVELYKEIHRINYLKKIKSVRTRELDYYYGISPEIISAII